MHFYIVFIETESKRNPMTPRLPTIDELIHIALTQTDFIGDLVPGDAVRIFDHAANAIDHAAEIWSEDHPSHGVVPTIPLDLIKHARNELTIQAHDMLADMAEAEADRVRDGQDAGDLDAAGDFIAYNRSFA
jgi:hypothetical protein